MTIRPGGSPWPHLPRVWMPLALFAAQALSRLPWQRRQPKSTVMMPEANLPSAVNMLAFARLSIFTM